MSDAATPIAEVVDLDGLLKTVLASLVAGVGVTVAFSTAVFGAVHFQEFRRAGQRRVAAAFGALGAIALLVVLAGIVVGLAIMLENRPEL